MDAERGFTTGRTHEVDLPEGDAVPRNRRRIILLVAIAGAVLLAGLYALFGGADAPTAAAPGLPRITVVVPGRQVVTSEISATGTLAARRDMPVGVSGDGGMVSRVLVEPGQWVAAGQTLAVIERSVQAEQANSLAAQISVARADAALAEAELTRARALVDRGFISKADVERRAATRDAAIARVKVAQAQLAEAQARIGRLDVRAPAAGLVLTRAVEPGQVVGPATEALFRIAMGGQMELLTRLAETDLAQMRVGLAATVTPVGMTRGFPGSIWQLSPVIDPTTRQGVVRIALGYDPALRPGGFAAARIVSGAADAPLLPESAVQSDATGNYVYVVDSGDRVRRRPVKIGQVNDKGIAVLNGLNGNEAVVLSAGAFLNPGDKVIPSRQAVR